MDSIFTVIHKKIPTARFETKLILALGFEIENIEYVDSVGFFATLC